MKFNFLHLALPQFRLYSTAYFIAYNLVGDTQIRLFQICGRANMRSMWVISTEQSDRTFDRTFDRTYENRGHPIVCLGYAYHMYLFCSYCLFGMKIRIIFFSWSVVDVWWLVGKLRTRRVQWSFQKDMGVGSLGWRASAYYHILILFKVNWSLRLIFF